MKNKEIEELLNNIKDKYSYEPYDTTGKIYTTISYEEGQLLLSYIEQLEDKINWYENIDINKTIDKFRVEHNKEIKELHNKIEQLENNRDKAIEYVEHHKFNKFGDIDCNEAEDIIDILKGDSE